MREKAIEILTSKRVKEAVYNVAVFTFVLLGLPLVILAGVAFGVLPHMMGWGLASAMIMSGVISIALAYLWRELMMWFIRWLREELLDLEVYYD